MLGFLVKSPKYDDISIDEIDSLIKGLTFSELNVPVLRVEGAGFNEPALYLKIADTTDDLRRLRDRFNTILREVSFSSYLPHILLGYKNNVDLAIT